MRNDELMCAREFGSTTQVLSLTLDQRVGLNASPIASLGNNAAFAIMKVSDNDTVTLYLAAGYVYGFT